MDILSKRLTTLRLSREWSKVTVQKKLKIKALSTYANWEYGSRNPDADMLVEIANLYDVSVDYLLGRVEDPKDYINKKILKQSENLTQDEEAHLKAVLEIELKKYRELKAKFSNKKE